MANPRAPRNTLTHEKLVAAALQLVDEDGLGAFTIRELASRLQVRPMAIYHYASSKDDLLDYLVDAVFGEVYLPETHGHWREELTHRSRSMRDTLGRHRWALAIMETRAHPGPATLTNHEAVLEVLRTSGFSLEAAAHAYAILDAFVYGFALQEAMLETVGVPADSARVMRGMDLRRFPRVAEMAAAYATADVYPLSNTFDVGLEIVMDGIQHFTSATPAS